MNNSELSVTARPRANAWLSLALGALVSIAALWLITRSVNFEQTLQTLANANLFLFALAFLTQLAAMACTTLRWQTLLRPYPTRVRALAQIYFSAHLLNTLLPAKLGTVARVLLASESEKLNVGFVFGSVAIEKVLDTIVTLLVLAVLSPFIPLPMWLRETLTLSVMIVLVGLVLVVSVARFRVTLLNSVTRLEARLARNNSQWFSSLARGVIESLVNLTQRREMLHILFWTACIWITGTLVNQLLFAALQLAVSWSAAWFVMIVLQIGTRVPALPANLGVFHYLVMLALSVYGIQESPSLAFAMLLHLIVFILPAFIGAVWALPLSARLIALVSSSLRQQTHV